jgi:hypothetical protein
MNGGIPQVLYQSRVVAKMTVACCTVEGMRRCVSFVLLQSLVAVESSIAEYATGAHSVKIVVNTAHISETRGHLRFVVEAVSQRVTHSEPLTAAMLYNL